MAASIVGFFICIGLSALLLVSATLVAFVCLWIIARIYKMLDGEKDD